MKLTRLFAFVGAALFAVGALAQTGAGPLAQLGAKWKAQRVVESFADGRFVDTVDAFHYPPNYSPEQLAKERASLKAMLTSLASELGAVSQIDESLPDGVTYEFWLGAGDISYWQAHPELMRNLNFKFQADTQSLGRVWFAVSLALVNGSWEVRTFGVQLLASRPGALDKIEEMFRKYAPKRET
jgi:hypothetical protein